VDTVIRIPPPAPPEMRYVPPGPHYGAVHRDGDAVEVSHEGSRDSHPLCKPKNGPGHHEMQTEAILLHPMETGYWMGRHEVTVGDFAPWFRRHRKEIVDWLAGVKVRHLTNSFTREIPPEEIRRAVDHEAQVSHWTRYAESFEAYLASAASERLPVVNVPLPIALAYAQTHAAPRAGELVPWIRSRLSEARGTMALLEAAAAEMAGSTEVLVPAGRLPGSPLLWMAGNCLFDTLPVGYLTPREAYYRWLTQESGFACEMPLEALREHGKKQPLPLGKEQLEETLGRLRNEPHLFLEDDPRALELRNHFFEAGHRDVVDRKHFVRWLDARKDELRSLSGVLERILDEIEGLPEAEVISTPIPWEVRLEYGYDLGWTLPSGAMFEKAFRGADDRRYPWGDEILHHTVLDSQYDEPQPVTNAGGDVSPYGIFGLAGNVSEWTIEPGFKPRHHYARGGCLWLGIEKAVAERLVRVRVCGYTKWIGFRVARAELPPGKYRREIRG
jgi:formylglycine-generating enzyme required for sulfatase activity